MEKEGQSIAILRCDAQWSKGCARRWSIEFECADVCERNRPSAVGTAKRRGWDLQLVSVIGKCGLHPRDIGWTHRRPNTKAAPDRSAVAAICMNFISFARQDHKVGRTSGSEEADAAVKISERLYERSGIDQSIDLKRFEISGCFKGPQRNCGKRISRDCSRFISVFLEAARGCWGNEQNREGRI